MRSCPYRPVAPAANLRAGAIVVPLIRRGSGLDPIYDRSNQKIDNTLIKRSINLINST